MISQSSHNPLAAAWLKTLSLEELLFLRDCHHSKEIKEANADKFMLLSNRYNEISKTESKRLKTS